jgi:hypothetical protein
MIAECMLGAVVYASVFSTLLIASLQGRISPVGRVVELLEQGIWAHHSNLGYSGSYG